MLLSLLGIAWSVIFFLPQQVPLLLLLRTWLFCFPFPQLHTCSRALPCLRTLLLYPFVFIYFVELFVVCHVFLLGVLPLPFLLSFLAFLSLPSSAAELY
jgi:hypothetical protein